MGRQMIASKISVRTRKKDSPFISFYGHDDGRQELIIKITDDLLKHMTDQSSRQVFRYNPEGIILAEYDSKKKLLTTHPMNLAPHSKYFYTNKYVLVKRISFEHARPILDDKQDDNNDGRFQFRQLPSGFVQNPFDGFGLIFTLRFIVDAIEEIKEVEEIRICRDSETSLDGEIFRLPISIYESLRKTLNRTHKSAVNFANQEKRNFLRSDLVLPHISNSDAMPPIQRTKADLKASLIGAINKPGRRSHARASRESSAVLVVKSSVKELITENHEQILELNREIELVTLEEVIRKFEARLEDQSLNEGSWQKFLSNNPFILRLAFGLPAVVFKEQMPVGGWDFDNTGGKLADFVMKSGAIGNLAIVEIKTPKAQLLRNTPYRGGVYAPSSNIVAAVRQVLDQRYMLQTHISQLLMNSKEEAYTYAVGCIVIIGITPTVESYKKSFELYRNNLNGIVVITFNEMLDKLKALHAFLIESPLYEKNNKGCDSANCDEIHELEEIIDY